jgi:tRNA dimethylallyltransferase
MKKIVYVISGPTATGKTALATQLAKRIGGEVVSADSMQVYKGMDIGTAKPSAAEMQGIPHHMIDIVEPDHDYSVAEYQTGANKAIGDILQRGKTPVLTGGSGLYINAITYALDFSAPADRALRDALEQKDAGELRRMLKERDAAAAERIHPNNKKRVIRALERALSGDQNTGYDFEQYSGTYDFRIITLCCTRDMLYERINARVAAMMADGLEREVRELAGKYGGAPTSMQAIGYKEFFDYFAGNASLDETTEAIKRNTRRLAKRQATWFRRDTRAWRIDISECTQPGEIVEGVLRRTK